MSKALINRSLTTIKTELEFLLDSEVITQKFFDTVEKALPDRYVAGAPPADLSATGVSSASVVSSAVSVASVSSSKAHEASSHAAPVHPEAPPPSYEATQEWRKTIYDYKKQAPEDLELRLGDIIKVLEKPNPNWYKGELNGKVGMFPVNYTEETSPKDAGSEKKEPAPLPVTHTVSTAPVRQTAPQPYVQPQSQYQPQPQQYQPQQYQPQPYVQPQQYQPQQYQPQPFPPPSVNYYQQPVQPQQPQQQHSSKASGAMKGFGKRLGEAAIFGAGATLGGDLVNSIF